jgi:general secretion pathway protein C
LELHGKKVSIGIVLVTLLFSALFLARGTTQLLAGALLPPEPAAPPKAAKASSAQLPGAQPPDPTAILARNIFDPTTGALWPPKVEEPPPTPEVTVENIEDLAAGQLPPPCEGALKLVASVYFEESPDWSFATLSTGSAQPLLYRQGSRVEDKEVVSVLPKAVFLRQGSGRLCSLLLFVDAAARAAKQPPTSFSGTPVEPTTTPAPMTAAALPGMTGGLSEEELNQSIRAVSETKFTVQRAFVDKILQNQAEIMRSARIVPHEENGQVVGVKLYGIRRNSLLGKLGLQNGDLMRTINGYAMSSPDTALEAYSKLRSANNLSVAVTRRGRQMSVDYDIIQ